MLKATGPGPSPKSKRSLCRMKAGDRFTRLQQKRKVEKISTPGKKICKSLRKKNNLERYS